MSTRKKPLRASKCIDFATQKETWELPRTAEAYDEMVEQGAKAVFAELLKVSINDPEFGMPSHCRAIFRAGLRSLGVTRQKERKETRK